MRKEFRHMIMKALVVMIMVSPTVNTYSMDDDLLIQWKEFSKKQDCAKIMKWLRDQAGKRIIGKQPGTCPDVDIPPFFGRLGMFITLKKGNRIRGCYGGFSHAMTDFGALLSDYLDGALTRDPRYPPLDIAELENIDIILTIASIPFPVDDIASVDVRRYGLMIVCNGEETNVFVPAEIKTLSYIERFIKGRSCQVSLFKAITIH